MARKRPTKEAMRSRMIREAELVGSRHEILAWTLNLPESGRRFEDLVREEAAIVADVARLVRRLAELRGLAREDALTHWTVEELERAREASGQ